MEIFENEILKNSKDLFASLNNMNWALTATERTIDNLFEYALKLEQISLQEDTAGVIEFLFQSYTNFNFSKPVDILLENIIKNQILSEHLTIYAIEKYNLLYPKEDFSKILQKILSEVELRKHLFELTEDLSDVDLDFLTLNKFLYDIMNSSDLDSKIQNALKFQTLVLLNAIKCGEFFTGQSLLNEIIFHLQSQTDLRLWFMIFKQENLEVVLDLCEVHTNFLNASFKFFDKFAEEIESNYDEELSIQYSHVNLDFEEFLKIFQLFLNKQSLRKKTVRYLESKTLADKNFSFWVDVKSCLSFQ